MEVILDQFVNGPNSIPFNIPLSAEVGDILPDIVDVGIDSYGDVIIVQSYYDVPSNTTVIKKIL